TVSLAARGRGAPGGREGAVLQIPGRACGFAADGEGIARQRQVRRGARRFGIVEILDGLDEGELVVSEGIVKLRDGSRVRFSSESKGVEDAADAARSADARS